MSRTPWSATRGSSSPAAWIPTRAFPTSSTSPAPITLPVRSIRAWSGQSSSIESHELEVIGLLVDGTRRRRYPIRVGTGGGHASHQRRDESAILIGGQPITLLRFPFRLTDDAAVGCNPEPSERSDPPIERLVRDD